MNKPVALTIAGSDPTGGAGIQADLKTFAAHGVYGVSAISVLTAQNVRRFETFGVPADFIWAQIEAVFEDFAVRAIKIGLLADKQTVRVLIEALRRFNSERRIPVVLDPVIRASNGGVALSWEGVVLLRDELMPLTTLIKPNIAEAALLLGEAEAASVEEMKGQASRLVMLGANHVLLSGGHLGGAEAVDILCNTDKTHVFRAKKLEMRDIHGTGCTLTSSIAANLAKGVEISEAVGLARTYIIALINHNHQLDRRGFPRSLDHLAIRTDRVGGA